MEEATVRKGEIQINPPKEIEAIKEDIKSIDAKLEDTHPAKGEVRHTKKI